MPWRKLHWAVGKRQAECLHHWHGIDRDNNDAAVDAEAIFIQCCWCGDKLDQWWEAAPGDHGTYAPENRKVPATGRP